MKIILAILAASLCWGQAVPTNPTAPLSVPSGVRPAPTGSLVPIHSGDDLQAKYNAASCGQDLVIDDGAVFTGNYVFNKQCTAPNWILVEGTGCSNGTTAIPTYSSTTAANLASSPPWAAPALTHYATINATSGAAAPIRTVDDTHVPAKYNYFGCLEVTSSANQFFLVGSGAVIATLASQVTDHIIFDRMYVHGVHGSSTVEATRAFVLEGSNISLVNSYTADIYQGEAQAVLLESGPGPTLITNNFLSGSTETLAAGGTPKTPGYTCTIAASPAPTTTSATVNACIDAASGSVATPIVGMQVMFYTSAGTPAYSPLDFTTITGNTAGALTFTAIPTPPIAGAGKVAWGIRSDDNTVTRNYFWKDPCWNSANPCYDGVSRSSKNFIESKYGQRWNISGNIFNNTWSGGQPWAFNFNSTDQTADCPWCFSSDINFQNNIVKNITGDFVIISTQDVGANCPPILNRVLIQNNLFWAWGTTPYISGTNGISLARINGTCTYPSTQAADSVQIIHNTMLGITSTSTAQLSDDNPFNFTNIVVRDNITQFNDITTGWFLVSGGCTNPCFASNASTGGLFTVRNNGIINGSGGSLGNSTITGQYGSMVLSTVYAATPGTNYAGAPFASYSTVNTDYHGYALTGSGPWRNAASDATDVGVNFSLLDAALGGSSTLTCSPKTHVTPPTVTDIQLQTNMALGITACTNSLTQSGACNSTDVQRVVNAALGGACVIGP